MKTVVVYFHGYASSPNSDKVDRLRSAGFDVYSFPIDVNPDISLPALRDSIDQMLVGYNDYDTRVVFVGTSLGAWYASVMGVEYDVFSILINPSFAPNPSLLKYDVPKDIVEKYFRMEVITGAKYFIGLEDEVLKFDKVMLSHLDTTYVENAGHRFNGPEFDLVIEYIKGLVK
jgi:hypothetical protein